MTEQFERIAADASGGSWHEWGRHVLSELDRLDRRASTIETELSAIRAMSATNLLRLDLIEKARERSRTDIIAISTAVAGLVGAVVSALIETFLK